MANRSMTATVLAQMAKNKTFPFFLLEMVFDVTPITLVPNTTRLTTAFDDIVFQGETWSAVGHFLGFTAVRETSENRITKLTVSVSGVDQSNISDFLTREYINRSVRIYLGFIRECPVEFVQAIAGIGVAGCAQAGRGDTIGLITPLVVADPFLLFDGLIGASAIEDDPNTGKSLVSLECVDNWEAFTAKPGRHTNHDEQQAFFPGDDGFEFVAKVPRLLKWGKE